MDYWSGGLPLTVLVTRFNLVLESIQLRTGRGVSNLESNRKSQSWPEPRTDGVWDAALPCFLPQREKAVEWMAEDAPGRSTTIEIKFCRQGRRINVESAISRFI